MAEETRKEEGKGFDVTQMARAWKEGYLKGVEAYLAWQEESENAVKALVRQNFLGPRQWLSLCKEWTDMPWDQIQGQTGGVPNPFLLISRQCAQAIHGTADPLLKTSQAVCENAIAYYEGALGEPSRKYVRDFNKQVLDNLIPG